MKRPSASVADHSRAAKRLAMTGEDPRSSKRRRRTRRSRAAGSSDHGQQTAPENLKPGQVYLVWERSKSWSAVLLLPTDAMVDIGVPETLETLGLSANLPECYEIDTRSKTCKWREGYEDDGPYAAERLYPVMDFDGPKVPKKRARWLAASEFKPYDEEIARSLDYFPQIQDYLQGKSMEDRPDEDKTIFVRGTFHGNCEGGR